MSDVLTTQQRSFCMSRNRGRDTGPEMILRKKLWAKGLRYRINIKLFGKPDLIITKFRVVVFVDGCYWHGCSIHFTQPKSNKEFWLNKINGNISRDKKVTQVLENGGWKVIRLWEHEIKQDLDSCVSKVLSACGKFIH